MHRPPPISQCLAYPVVTAICWSAIVVTFWGETGGNIDKLTVNPLAFQTEPWRLVTCIFPHGNIFHLIFNLYWIWAFGTTIESVFGSARTFAIILMLAIGSSVAEYALFSGGIGLSGVGYGFFGLLWVLSRSDSRFFGAVDHQVAVLLTGWFFLCILFTITGTMAVGNVAHGSGAVLGAMLGWTIAAKNRQKQIAYGLLLAIVFLAIMAAGSVGRRYVNIFDEVAKDEANRARLIARDAYSAILDGDYAHAAELYRKALAIDDKQAHWWYNLGIIYKRLNSPQESEAAFRRAIELDPDNKIINKQTNLRQKWTIPFC